MGWRYMEIYARSIRPTPLSAAGFIRARRHLRNRRSRAGRIGIGMDRGQFIPVAEGQPFREPDRC